MQAKRFWLFDFIILHLYLLIYFKYLLNKLLTVIINKKRNVQKFLITSVFSLDAHVVHLSLLQLSHLSMLFLDSKCFWGREKEVQLHTQSQRQEFYSLLFPGSRSAQFPHYAPSAICLAVLSALVPPSTW